MKKKVSVILPTYNEQDNIISIINSVHDVLSNYDHEILVVDDNSSDGTYTIVEGANYSFVKSILRTKDRGYAKSIRCGIENSTGDIIIIMDSDFNHPTEHLPFMVEALSYYDYVIGSRFIYGGQGLRPLRHTLSWLFNLYIRFITGGRITDNLSSFLTTHREIIERLDYDNIFWGFGDFYIRLTYYIQKQGAKVLQIPVIYGKRTEGKGNADFIKLFLQYSAAAIKLVLKNGRLKQ